MTEEQRQAALTMRAENRTFAEISALLGIPTSTLKSCMKRENKVEKRTVETGQGETAVCRQCGQVLRLHSGNRMKRFCSERCRQRWWRANRGAVTQKASVAQCAHCGKLFKNGGNPKRRYCCQRCYFRHRFGEGAVSDE